jgi:hypothetical protein
MFVLKRLCSPTPLFLFMEAIINISLVVEVLLRVIALKNMYWTSIVNIVDFLLVIVCFVTLGFLAGGCSPGSKLEEAADTAIIAFRSAIQLARLVSFMNRFI